MITPEFIARCRCPWCGAGLRVEHAAAEPSVGGGEAGAIRQGVVACECCRYPIINGILVLQQGATFRDEHREAAVAAVLAGDRERALHSAMLASNLINRGRLAAAAARVLRALSPRLRERYGQRIDPGLVMDERATFEELALALRPAAFAHYLVQRYANPSLMAAIPLMVLLGRHLAARAGGGDGREARRPLVIDLGAGAGHASCLLSALAPGAQVITSDSDFISLCLARRLLGEGATIIGLDAEAPLPFEDGSLDAVFSLDAYHYMRSKVAVARELRRVVRPGGLWVFPHLHNALLPNPAPGYPLPPSGYRRCFEGIDARLLPEAEVLRGFVEEGALDLSRETPTGDLEGANALCMIGSAAPDEAEPRPLWSRHEGLARAYVGSATGLGLNPVYEVEPKPGGGVMTARRAWASERLRRECIGADAYLPERVEVEAGFIERLSRGEVQTSDVDRVRELMRSFVLVPMPEKYRAPGRRLGGARAG